MAEESGNKSQTARDLNISRSCIRSWMKTRESLCENDSITQKSRRIRYDPDSRKIMGFNPLGESRVYEWFRIQRVAKIGVSRLSIMDKMRADQLNNPPIKPIKVTYSWLDRFMDRNQLSLRRISGSGRSFPANSKEIIQNYLGNLHGMIALSSFEPNEIFGFDETCFRLDSPNQYTVSEVGARKTYSKTTGKEKAKFVIIFYIIYLFFFKI